MEKVWDRAMTLRKIVFAVGIVLVLTASIAAITSSGEADMRSLALDRSDTYQIARLTGPTSINRTDAMWNVYGTDLGHMFEHRGRLYMAFGDTFGSPGRPPNFGDDWRGSTLALVRESDPWDGLSFEAMITDRPGHAKTLIDKSAVPGEEFTVIPTNGVSVDDRMFLHYMAVRQWAYPGPGQWQLNRSGLAYSDDDGQNWTVSDAWWPADSNFGQVAFLEQDDYVYLFGIPGGRLGEAHLARVESQAMLELDRYEFWDGTDWVSDNEAAVAVVPAPVGELSVQWNSHYRKWLMMYLNVDKAVKAIVLRTADCLVGPWSDEQTIVTSREVPQLYGPYMPPRWNNGPDIFFTLSRYDVYDVFWWHTSLTGDPGSAQEERCISP